MGGRSFFTKDFLDFRAEVCGGGERAVEMPFDCRPLAGVMRSESDWNVLSLRFLVVTGLDGSVFALLPGPELGWVLLAELVGAIA